MFVLSPFFFDVVTYNDKNFNLKALRSNSDDFWKKHCTAVPALIKSEDLELPADSESLTANASTFKVVSNSEFKFSTKSSILTFTGNW